jgi:aryl-alcohol dehydrogenase-like predicted oxidoreductase
VVANGRLVPGSTDSQPAAAAAHDLAATLDAGLDQVAMAAALAQPWAWRVLSGAVTTQQLAQNLAGEHLHLTLDDVRAVTQHAQAPGDYWAERSGRGWT